MTQEAAQAGNRSQVQKELDRTGPSLPDGFLEGLGTFKAVAWTATLTCSPNLALRPCQ